MCNYFSPQSITIQISFLTSTTFSLLSSSIRTSNKPFTFLHFYVISLSFSFPSINYAPLDLSINNLHSFSDKSVKSPFLCLVTIIGANKGFYFSITQPINSSKSVSLSTSSKVSIYTQNPSFNAFLVFLVLGSYSFTLNFLFSSKRFLNLIFFRVSRLRGPFARSIINSFFLEAISPNFSSYYSSISSSTFPRTIILRNFSLSMSFKRKQSSFLKIDLISFLN